MSELEIRILTPSDAETFWQLRLRALKEEPDAFSADYKESAKLPMEDVRKRLEEKHSFIVGAFNPNLVGMVCFSRRQGIKVEHKGTIWGVYLAPEHRGTGIAKKLFLEAFARCRQIAGLEQVVLAVSTGNTAAYKLYTSLGFTSYGLERKVLKFADRYVDEEYLSFDLG